MNDKSVLLLARNRGKTAAEHAPPRSSLLPDEAGGRGTASPPSLGGHRSHGRELWRAGPVEHDDAQARASDCTPANACDPDEQQRCRRGEADAAERIGRARQRLRTNRGEKLPAPRTMSRRACSRPGPATSTARCAAAHVPSHRLLALDRGDDGDRETRAAR